MVECTIIVFMNKLMILGKSLVVIANIYLFGVAWIPYYSPDGTTCVACDMFSFNFRDLEVIGFAFSFWGLFLGIVMSGVMALLRVSGRTDNTELKHATAKVVWGMCTIGAFAFTIALTSEYLGAL